MVDLLRKHAGFWFFVTVSFILSITYHGSFGLSIVAGF